MKNNAGPSIYNTPEHGPYLTCEGASRAVFLLAVTVHIERVVTDLKFEYFCDHVANALNPGVTKLKQLVAIQTDEMVVLPETEGSLVFGLLVSELMPDHQVASDQQLQCVVNRCAAYGYFVLAQSQMQFVGVEMVVGLVDSLKDGRPLSGLTQVLLP